MATLVAANGSLIKASVLHGARDLRIDQVHIGAPAPHELQIAVQATGLCGSDLHYYQHFRNGDILVKEPLSLGHESAGVVTAMGQSVEGFALGDKVALEVGLPCDTCERCTQERYNLCKGMNFRSSARRIPHFQGTLQQQINHPAKWCFKLPKNVTLEVGALVEPLAVAMHAVKRSEVQKGSRVLVLGAGAIGLLTAAAAGRSGAKEIVIADIDAGRLDFATGNKFATSSYLMPRRPRSESTEQSFENAKEDASSLLQVGGLSERDPLQEFDVVYECTGVPSCAQTAIYATRPGGRVMLVGMGSSTLTLPVGAAQSREVDLLMVFRYAGTYQSAIDMLAKPSADGPELAKLITHVYNGLGKAAEAFEMAGKTKDEASGRLVLKVVIRETELTDERENIELPGMVY